jgi:YaiO family outer membrane protein
MTRAKSRSRRFSVVLCISSFMNLAAGLVMSLVSVPYAYSQSVVGSAIVASCSAASSSPNSADSEQASPQPPDTGIPLPPVQAPPGPKLLTDYVEAGGDYLHLTNDFGYWTGGYARGVVTQGNNIWNAEINGQHEFGDAGVYLALGDTYTFSPDWYGSLTAGSSVGGFFWPRFRADGFLNKKWASRKQLVTTFGFGYNAAKDAHRDHSLFLGSTYYFTKPWILEEGVRFNVSNPGSVFSAAGFAAVTVGRNKQHYLTLRSGFGKEAYQLIGPAAQLSDFKSQTFTVTWRQWVGINWGFNLVGDFYHSPFYMRGGTSLGFFREF